VPFADGMLCNAGSPLNRPGLVGTSGSSSSHNPKGRVSSFENTEPTMDAELPRATQNPIEHDDHKRAWLYYSHGDTILHSRFMSFLIAEAFLVGAFATTLNSENAIKILIFQLCTVGLAVAISILFFAFHQSLHSKLLFVKDKYLDKDMIWRQMDQRSEVPSDYSSKHSLSRVRIYGLLPIFLVVFWAILGIVAVFSYLCQGQGV
jgi:hypothetical protein